MSLQILIVDDEPQIGAMLGGLLTDAGHLVSTCLSGEEALEHLQHHPADLIFLDLRLSGMSGLEVLQRLNEQSAGIAAIVISAHADIDLAVKATRLGAYNLLEKPLQPERVLLEVEHVSERLRLEKERDTLRQRLGDTGEMVGESIAMQRLRQMIAKAAPSDARVLITGENGTGKELVADAIHKQSFRRNSAFVRVNCAAIPHELIESELFGHERGAFTGAMRRKIGMIEQANGGTLFLDEIGDMALDTQAKLLRVLQQNELLRVGGSQTIPFDVRVISATNKDLEDEIHSGRFREDLFFRLAVIPIEVPPLRDRLDDVPILASYFLQHLAITYGKRPKKLSADIEQLLTRYQWPGNVRELRNIIERLMIMNDDETLTAQHFVHALPSLSPLPMNFAPPATEILATGEKIPTDISDGLSLRDQLESFERQLLSRYFSDSSGNVSEMARRLRTDRANLHRKLQRYNIK